MGTIAMSKFDRITLLLVCFCILLAVSIVVMAQGESYLLLYSLYVFEYQDNPPFETIRPMQWDSVKGFSEITENPDYLYTIVYLKNGSIRHGYVMQDVSTGDCFFLEMQTDDAMGNPHVERNEWVSCDAN